MCEPYPKLLWKRCEACFATGLCHAYVYVYEFMCVFNVGGKKIRPSFLQFIQNKAFLSIVRREKRKRNISKTQTTRQIHLVTFILSLVTCVCVCHSDVCVDVRRNIGPYFARMRSYFDAYALRKRNTHLQLLTEFWICRESVFWLFIWRSLCMRTWRPIQDGLCCGSLWNYNNPVV